MVDNEHLCCGPKLLHACSHANVYCVCLPSVLEPHHDLSVSQSQFSCQLQPFISAEEWLYPEPVLQALQLVPGEDRTLACATSGPWGWCLAERWVLCSRLSWTVQGAVWSGLHSVCSQSKCIGRIRTSLCKGGSGDCTYILNENAHIMILIVVFLQDGHSFCKFSSVYHSFNIFFPICSINEQFCNVYWETIRDSCKCSTSCMI